MEKELNILILEDVSTDVELVERELKKAKINFLSVTVSTKEEFLRQIKANSFDIIISDYNLPQFNAMEALNLIHSNNLKIPFVLVTGSLSEEIAVECMKQGADDYILKQNLARLPAAILNVLAKKEAEKAKVKAEARVQSLVELEQTKELLTSLIIHDMRNPLSAVIGAIQIMQMKSQKIDRQTMQYINIAAEACQRILEIINQIVDVMRMEDKKMPIKITKNDLVLLAKEKTSQYKATAEANEIKLSEQSSIDSLETAFDKELIGRVIENLMTNAIKHTLKGGSVKVGISRSTDSSNALISIEDSGEGIPKEYLNKIFEKYGQVELKKLGRRYDTGLGLVFSKMAVELHNGKINVESEIGKGSKFIIELPIK